MANPLTLLLPVAEGADLTQLGGVLMQNSSAIEKALKEIGTVHYLRTLVLDRSSPNLQPTPNSVGPFLLAVITEYDGDFEPYTQDFALALGDVFNALLSFVDGAQGLVPLEDHLDEVIAFVKANDASQNPHCQIATYSAYPYGVQQILGKFPPTS